MIVLEFEKPIFELESKIRELKKLNGNDLNITADVNRLENKLKSLIKSVYSELTPWQIVQVARHQDRPKTIDYVNSIFSDFEMLAGDRNFSEDKAIVAGIGKFNGIPVAILGHQKGKDTEDRIAHNFGMPHPEGYRKAYRIMELADRFNLPLITFIDTAGAYPGVGAEERGQAESIGKCLEKLSQIKVPVISTIIGEGGSGGAVALAFANKLLMLEFSVYSVISPEGCASILWRNPENAPDAAECLKITARDLMKFGLIDSIVKEPLGGAHKNHKETIENVSAAIKDAIVEMKTITDLRAHRNEKFLNFGVV